MKIFDESCDYVGLFFIGLNLVWIVGCLRECLVDVYLLWCVWK